MNRQIPLAWFLGTLLTLASGLAGAATEAGETSAKQAIAAAEQARQKAASVDSEWKAVSGLIKEAQKALADGRYEQAISLARQAESQGSLGYQQGVSQQKLTMPPAYMR
jgi:Skp family chaperone for outer membrane proteins